MADLTDVGAAPIIGRPPSPAAQGRSAADGADADEVDDPFARTVPAWALLMAGLVGVGWMAGRRRTRGSGEQQTRRLPAKSPI